MPRHIVRQGESIASIARQYRVAVDVIWSHADNETVRGARTTPYVLKPGDVVWVPTQELRRESADTGRRHRYRVQRGLVELAARFLCEGAPKGGWAYRVRIHGDEHEGALDDDGWLRLRVRPDATRAEVTLTDPERERTIREAHGDEEPPPAVLRLADERHVLLLHHLDPSDEHSGAAQRLTNLGFACDAPDPGTEGDDDDDDALAFAGALHAFQKANGLSETGTLDDATRAKLEELHGV